MGYTLYDLDMTDANNTSFAGISQAENVMRAPAVNNAFRALDGALARFIADGGGTVTTGGSANAQTVTLNQAIATTVPTGFFFTVKFGYTNTSTTVTLNVNSIGAKSVKVFRGTALGDPAVGDVQKDNYGHVLYDGTQFVLLNPSLLSAANTWSAQQSFTNSALDVQVGQIKFPATQNPSSNANTLDDYEEGTFTPAFSASGSTFSYAAQIGLYIKIGSLVYFNIVLQLNTSGNTLTGSQLSITGLPFASSTAGSTRVYPAGWSNSTSNIIQMLFQLNGNSSSFLAVTTTGGAAATSSFAALNANGALHATNGSSIVLNGAYLV